MHLALTTSFRHDDTAGPASLEALASEVSVHRHEVVSQSLSFRPKGKTGTYPYPRGGV